MNTFWEKIATTENFSDNFSVFKKTTFLEFISANRTIRGNFAKFIFVDGELNARDLRLKEFKPT